MADHGAPLAIVLDDEFRLAELVCAALRDAGISAHGCTNASEAFWFIGRFRPKLIVLDVQMPGVNGIELVEQLRADPFLAQTALILLTANPQRLHRHLPDFAQHGAVLIAKPFELSQLLVAVQDVLITG